MTYLNVAIQCQTISYYRIYNYFQRLIVKILTLVYFYYSQKYKQVKGNDCNEQLINLELSSLGQAF